MNSPAPVSFQPIFATPFASFALTVPADFNSELQEMIAARVSPAHRDPSVPFDALSFRSREDVFEWPDPRVRAICASMLGAVATVVKGVNVYTEKEFADLRVQGRAHFAVVLPDGGLPVTEFAMCSWCAIYCVTAPQPVPDRPHSGMLRLYEPRLGNSYVDASTWRMREPYAEGHYTWLPRPGMMAVFPAYVPHEFAQVRGSGSLTLIRMRVRFATPMQEVTDAW